MFIYSSLCAQSPSGLYQEPTMLLCVSAIPVFPSLVSLIHYAISESVHSPSVLRSFSYSLNHAILLMT